MKISDIKMLPPQAITDIVEAAEATALDELANEIILAGGTVKMMHTTLVIDRPAGTLSIQGWGGMEYHVYPLWIGDIREECNGEVSARGTSSHSKNRSDG